MIYFAEAVGIGHIKIGYTGKEDAVERLADMQTGCPVPLRVLGLIPGTLDDEKDLHRRFASAHVAGAGKEWFKPTSEILTLIPAGEVRSCKGVEVIARSVQIKVLTVGRKQFTKTLLQQLPEKNPFNDYELWDVLYDKDSDLELLGKTFVLQWCSERAIDYWGWVETDNSPLTSVLEMNGVLYRYATPRRTPPRSWKVTSVAFDPPKMRYNETTVEFADRERQYARHNALRDIWSRWVDHWLIEQNHLYFGV